MTSNQNTRWLWPHAKTRKKSFDTLNTCYTSIVVITTCIPLLLNLMFMTNVSSQRLDDHMRTFKPYSNQKHTAQPRFHVQPEDQEVELGARVQLRCSGDASPTYLLYWYKEGHRQLLFPSSNAPMIANPAALVGAASGLTSSDWPQAAALVADNQYLGSSAPITSKMLNPALMSPASSDTSPATNKLFSIGPEQLAPNVYNNNYFGNRIYVDNRGTLNIVNVTSSDNGYYACALISPVGSVMTKAKVTVRGVVASNNQQYSPSDIYVDPTSMTTDALSGVYSASSVSKFDLLPPPIIRMGSVDQSLPINSSATIICDVLSRVNYEIKWSFNDRNVEPDGVRVIFFENGSLQINNLMTTDSGKYTCIATATDDPPQLASANPNEPIDASMLTAAPPTRRSTSHSAMLLVASPVQFNVPLHKMNIYEYPSAPGQAYAVTTLDSNNQDSITLAWAAPTDSGTLPITDYIVEHYDTAQEQDGWKVIYRIKGKEALQVDGLSSDGSHFFVIRALNSRGAGPSSPISEPLRTPAGEAKYLLELQRRGSRADIGGSHRPDANVARDKLMTLSTSLIDLVPMSSTSIRLRWATLIMANQTSMESTTNYPLLSAPDVKEFLEGYSIRYRAIGIGESVLDSAASQRPRKEAPNQFALPLVTSFLDETIESEHVARNKRDVLSSYIDYTQEFKEIRVVDHNTQYSTVKDLRPFTMYEFFVVPFFKEIDGVPSNILSAQTLEDRPAIGPPSLTIRPINDTAVRLMWLHVPPIYANGILRGYVVQLNRSDAYAADSDSQAISARAIDANPKFLNLPLGVLGVVPYGPPQQQQQQQTRATTYNFQQYIVMYDLTNLTYKSFYSAQVAALTSVGPGPWSEQQNFIMDPKLATQMRSTGNDFDDVMGRAFMANGPRSYAHESQANVYVVGSSIMIVFIIVVALGLALYRRNNQKVITWKKTISEHFTNKFYMPSTIEHAHHHHHREPNSMQQNIYDHQQHLIYSNSTTPAHLAHHHQQQQQQPHHLHQSIPSQTLWTNGNGCGVTTTSTGACLDRASSSLHGLLAINNDADANHQLVRRMNGADQQQQLLMNTAGANKDMTSRFANGVTSVAQCGTQMRQSDYYSVINNMAEYEELGQHQQRHINNNNNNSIQMQAASNYNQHHNHMPPSMADRHQTTSSNSDTSCPSSVTRLLPNQQSQHNKNVLDMHRQDMILHQQLVGAFQSDNNDANKQAFASLISSNPSPYATTNLIAHAPMTNNQLVMQHTSAGVTMDDSKIFGGQMMGAHNGQHVAVNQPFRTMQRGGGGGHFVVSSNQQPAQHQQQQIVVHHTARSHQAQHSTISNANQAVQIATNVTNNPLACAQDNRSASNNVYEHIDYNIDALAQRQRADMMISSSASSGSMLSSSQPNSPPEHNNNNGGSSASSSSHQANRKTGEAHDLRVFSKVRGSDAPELQRFVLNDDDNNARVNGAAGPDDADRLSQADETTAFRQQSLAGSDRRTRQLSKRKRQQQRTYMHNNSQPVG